MQRENTRRIRNMKTLTLAKGATLAFAGSTLTLGTVATPAPAADCSGKRIEFSRTG